MTSPSSVGISVSPPLQDRGSLSPFSVTAPFGFLLDSYGCFLVPMAVENLLFSRSCLLLKKLFVILILELSSSYSHIVQDGS